MDRLVTEVLSDARKEWKHLSTQINVVNMDLGTIVLTLVAVFMVYLYFQSSRKKHARLPPGPPNLPLVGSLPFLGKDIREPLRKLINKYGEMTTVYLGSRQIIFLNTLDVIREAFSKNGDIFSGRPQDLFFFKEIMHNKGLMSTEGVLWKEQRRFSHSVLKELGMGKGFLEPKVLEEIQTFLAVLDGTNGEPMNPYMITSKAVANVIVSIVTGNRNDYDDADFHQFIQESHEAVATVSNSGILVALPFLRYLPGDLLSIKELAARLEATVMKMSKKILAIKESRDRENPRCFIDMYLTKMEEEQKDNPNTTFTDDQLLWLTFDLLGAGTETSSNTLLWGMIFMLRNPDVMKRCQAEIDDVIGRKRTPSMRDKISTPYVEATLMEIQRMGDLVPFALPHSIAEDIEFKGYHFPKGTSFMPNIYAVHFDPVTWPEPEVFNPSRHLTEDGKLFKRDELIPFSVGKRACLGESLAKMELFLFFISLLQRYDLVLPPGMQVPAMRAC